MTAGGSQVIWFYERSSAVSSMSVRCLSLANNVSEPKILLRQKVTKKTRTTGPAVVRKNFVQGENAVR